MMLPWITSRNSSSPIHSSTWSYEQLAELTHKAGWDKAADFFRERFITSFESNVQEAVAAGRLGIVILESKTAAVRSLVEAYAKTNGIRIVLTETSYGGNTNSADHLLTRTPTQIVYYVELPGANVLRSYIKSITPQESPLKDNGKIGMAVGSGSESFEGRHASGRALLTFDGWHSVEIPKSEPFGRLGYFRGNWVVGTGSNKILASPDLTDWKTMVVPSITTNGRFRGFDIAASSNCLLVAGVDGSGALTHDLRKWQTVEMPMGGSLMTGVAHSGGVWTVIGSKRLRGGRHPAYDTSMYYSTNGALWTKAPLGEDSTVVSTWKGDSTNFVVLTRVSLGTYDSNFSLLAKHFLGDGILAGILASDGGEVLAAISRWTGGVGMTDVEILASADMRVWTTRKVFKARGAKSNPLGFFTGDYGFLVVCEDGSLLYAADGKRWQSIAPAKPARLSLLDVQQAGSLVVATCGSGEVLSGRILLNDQR